MMSRFGLGIGVGITNAQQIGSAPVPPAVPRNSILLGTTGNDYVYINSAPDIFTGVLVSAWAKNPAQIAYPWTEANKYLFALQHAVGGAIWCIALNGTASDSEHALSNQNITYPNGGGDMLGWIAEQHPESQILDWCHSAWQFIYAGVNPADVLTFRQWFRFGWMSAYIIKESTMTVAEMRTLLGDPLWVPTALTGLYFGDTGAQDANTYSMTRVRVYEYGGSPTQAQITGIARGEAPTGIPTPWLDSPFEWVDGAADISDVSGNGRTLLVSGTLYQGLNCDEAVRTDGPYIVQATPFVNSGGAVTSMDAVFETACALNSVITADVLVRAGIGPTITDSQSNSYTTTIATTSWGRHAAIAVAPVTTPGATIVTVSNMGEDAGTLQAFEWAGVDYTNPIDWSVANSTETDPLTITAGQASSVAGVVGLMAVQTNGYNDATIQPAGWTCFNGTGIINANDIVGKRRFGAVSTEVCSVPDQVGVVAAVGVMVGLKPA